jgi:anti-sigma B factor antagonist
MTAPHLPARGSRQSRPDGCSSSAPAGDACEYISAFVSPDHTAFSIETSEEGGRLLVRPRGELDLATAPDLEQLLMGRLAGGGRVVLDLRELSFMDSNGVRVLVTAHARASDDGEDALTIVRPVRGGAVDRIIEVSGIDRALRLVDDV